MNNQQLNKLDGITKMYVDEKILAFTFSNGISGTFSTVDSIITVTNGIITNITII